MIIMSYVRTFPQPCTRRIRASPLSLLPTGMFCLVGRNLPFIYFTYVFARFIDYVYSTVNYTVVVQTNNLHSCT